MNNNSFENYENENQENFSVSGVTSYSVNLFGHRVNIWVLLLVVAVLLVAVFYERNKRLPSLNDLSATSSMQTIAQQMGGFDLSDTPRFIKKLW
jgi:hypothetical protein